MADRNVYISPAIERLVEERLGISVAAPEFRAVATGLFTAMRRGQDVGNPAVIQRVIRDARQRLADREASEQENRVYYVRCGDLIKIGTAVDMKRRMAEYPPNAELLATEAGSYNKERDRLDEFAEYLAARMEWFTPGPRLMAHIDTLRRQDLTERGRL